MLSAYRTLLSPLRMFPCLVSSYFLLFQLNGGFSFCIGANFSFFTKFCQPGASNCPSRSSWVAATFTSTLFFSELSSLCVARC
jgi:hypothetical protein